MSAAATHTPSPFSFLDIAGIEPGIIVNDVIAKLSSRIVGGRVAYMPWRRSTIQTSANSTTSDRTIWSWSTWTASRSGGCCRSKELSITPPKSVKRWTPHSKKITHRDLKAANILVTKQGIKLLDFGLAKMEKPVAAAQETVTMALTSQGQILGTLRYMSPEQLQGKEGKEPMTVVVNWQGGLKK